MSLDTYKIIHLFGIFLLFLAIGATLHNVINGGTKASDKWKKGIGMTHGIALALILIAGFGMIARLHTPWPWPGWVWMKIVIWMIMGAMLAIAYKQRNAGKALWIIVPLLGALAAFFALIKPF